MLGEWAGRFCCALGFVAFCFPHARAGEAPSSDCVVEPFQVSRVAAPVEGVVDTIDVERGQHVKKGQVLARLDARLEASSLALARARAANDQLLRSVRARSEFQRRRKERLQQIRGVVAEATVDEAESDARVSDHQARDAEFALDIARLEAERARVQLDQRTVVSPLDGVVVERSLSPGEYRHAQTHILTIAQINPLRVEAFLPIRDFRNIRVGDAALVHVEQPIGGTHQARVTIVDRVFDAASGTFGVRLEMPNNDEAIPAGLRCRLELGAASSSASAAVRR